MGILAPIEWVVAWIVYGSHHVLTFLGMPDGPGLAWVLSIVMLTVIIRAAMIPLFVRQIKAQRGMAAIQPQMQAIQKKYKDKKDPDSRAAMSRETVALYKEHGTNPMSSCVPALLQAPFFFALFRVLNAILPIASGERDSIGPITQPIAADLANSSIFGANLSASFLGTESISSRVLIAILILLMSASMFYTQRQMMSKNMAPTTAEGPMAGMQKMMLYGMPVIFAVSGVNFPLGVLIYWTATNFWTMGQQAYSIRRNPTPGSKAEAEMKERRAAKAAAKGVVLEPEPVAVAVRGQRQKPQRKNRSKKG